MSQSDHEWVAATGLMAALAGVLIVLLAVSRAGGPEIAQLRAEAPQVAAASTPAPPPAAPAARWHTLWPPAITRHYTPWWITLQLGRG